MYDDNQQQQSQAGVNPVPTQPLPEPIADGSMSDMSPVFGAPIATTPMADPPPESFTPIEPTNTDDTSTSGEPITTSPQVTGDANDLLGVKQQALQQLTPLVSHLDQTPEEKFRTTMMLIQASDDQTLVATAFEAAKAITDDKSRAQALLDIVNEINYFTQQHKNQDRAVQQSKIYFGDKIKTEYLLISKVS